MSSAMSFNIFVLRTVVSRGCTWNRVSLGSFLVLPLLCRVILENYNLSELQLFICKNYISGICQVPNRVALI